MQTEPGELAREDSLFDWVDGVARFRGLPVQWLTLTLAGRTFKLAGLADAADLLDQPDFAKRFIEEDRAPYGMELWPSAAMLAADVLRGEDGAGRRAIEIGCGLGLVAMAATLMGWRVCVTDHDPTSLRFAEYNAALNNIELATLKKLDWNEPCPEERFERVFGADLLYERANHMPVLKCIAGLLEPQGVAALTDPNRSVADGFEAMARESGFDVRVSLTSDDQVRGRKVGGRLLLLRFKDAL